MLEWIRWRRASLRRRRVFEAIYVNGDWGQGVNGERYSGRGSRDPLFIDGYVAAVGQFVRQQSAIHRLVDLGCGDFNVGRHFLGMCGDYQACDISSAIIEQNRSTYPAAPVRFEQRDIVARELPRGDVALLRQVLQHLSNSDVATLVDRLHRERPYRYLIVTEHVPAGTDWPRNRDMPAGGLIRLSQGSGIDLSAEPFRLSYRRVDILCEVTADEGGQPAVVRTTCYAL